MARGGYVQTATDWIHRIVPLRMRSVVLALLCAVLPASLAFAPHGRAGTPRSELLCARAKPDLDRRAMNSFLAGATASLLVAAPELALANDFIGEAEERAIKEGEAESKAVKKAADAEKKAAKKAADAEKKAAKRAADAEKKAAKQAADAEKKAARLAAQVSPAEKREAAAARAAQRKIEDAEKKEKAKADALAKKETEKAAAAEKRAASLAKQKELSEKLAATRAEQASKAAVSDEQFLKVVNDKEAYQAALGKVPRKKVDQPPQAPGEFVRRPAAAAAPAPAATSEPAP